MIKQKECVVLVSSVQEVIKFYTEKLAFDIVDIEVNGEEDLQAVHLRKGKCFLTFRRPTIQESVEFSFIKGCPSRCLTVSIEVTKDLDKILQRYEKKGVSVVNKVEDANVLLSFTIKDPFGLRLHFFQEPPATHAASFLEKTLTKPAKGKATQERFLNTAVERLQSYGIVRRAAKKFCKAQLKAAAK